MILIVFEKIDITGILCYYIYTRVNAELVPSQGILLP